MTDTSYNLYDKITTIDWNGQYFVLTARSEITNDSFSYAYSSDGISWTKTAFYTNLTARNPYSVKPLGDNFTATGNLVASSYSDASGNTITQNCIVDIIDGQYPISIPTNITGNAVVYDIERDMEYPNRIIFPRTTELALGNTIAYSTTQGEIWNNVTTSPFSYSANDAVWNGKLWVAVGTGTGNTIATSLDGFTWIGRGNYIFSESCNGIDWNPHQKKYVAIGNGTNAVATSMDGIYWKGTNTNLFSSGGNDIKWNGRIWVAVGNDNSSGNTIAYSVDAISWNYSIVSFQTAGIKIYHDGSTWTVFGSDPSYNMATSSDGINWILYYSPIANLTTFDNPTGLFADLSVNLYPTIPYPLKECNTISSIQKYIYNNSDRGCAQIQPVSIACGSGSHSLAYSIDGIQWSVANNSIFTRSNRAIWNGTLWIAIGTGNYWIAASRDGISWTGINNTSMSEGYDIAWNGHFFVAVGTGSSRMVTSQDGINWTPVSIASIFSESIHSIEWTGTVWLAYGEGTNTTAISSSLNASVWTPTPTPNLCIVDCSNLLTIGLVDSSASSYQGTDIPANAFDGSFNTVSTKWSSASSTYDASGNYIGTSVTQGISGEWLQVNLNNPLSCSNYYIVFSIADGNAIPKSWTLFGSSNESVWTELDAFDYGANSPPDNNWKYPFVCLPLAISQEYVSGYSYYRLVFTKSFGSDHVRVTELALFDGGEKRVSSRIRPIILKDLILHPTRILSVDGMVPNIYRITDLSCNLIRSAIVHNGEHVNNIVYGLTSGPSATAFDGINHVVLSASGEVSYLSNSASNTNLNFDNSMNGMSISGITGEVSAACYNCKFILVGSSYGVLNNNSLPIFYSNNLSSLFTTLNSLASNSGYGFVVSQNKIYLKENERLSLVTPKFYDSAIYPDTNISFNVYGSSSQ